MAPEGNRYLKRLPSVDELLRRPEIAALTEKYPRATVVDTVRKVLQERRKHLLETGFTEEEVSRVLALETITGDVVSIVTTTGQPRLRRIINATGVVLHTNLGRAPLAEGALAAIERAGKYYTNLELDLATGKRGSRYIIVEELLLSLTGAEAAFVVNNNAAAVLLALSSLATGKEVVVSRGQLVEIGGSFRIPDVMRQSGARLVEVGTTNKTYLRDYEAALGPETALLLHVHASNYRIIGFTHETTVTELAELGRRHGIPVMSDLGSGFLVDLNRYGLPYEPTVQETVAAGADVVTFSGDKLLGGPQAGIILGKAALVERMKHHPLARALRVDKLTLAALEATLREYLDPETALRNIPALRMLTTPPKILQRRAYRLVRRLRRIPDFTGEARIVAITSRVGGGAMPTAEPPSYGVAIPLPGGEATKIAALLRQGDPPVIARIQEDRLVFDMRTLRDEELGLLAEAVCRALAGGAQGK